MTAAYVFLRDVEHKLQMVQDFQTHALPDSAEELERCAIRGGYGSEHRPAALKQFQADHVAHTALVHKIFRPFFESPKTFPLFQAMLRLIKILK